MKQNTNFREEPLAWLFSNNPSTDGSMAMPKLVQVSKSLEWIGFVNCEAGVKKVEETSQVWKTASITEGMKLMFEKEVRSTASFCTLFCSCLNAAFNPLYNKQ